MSLFARYSFIDAGDMGGWAHNVVSCARQEEQAGCSGNVTSCRWPRT
jgi:hypothetical protein